MQFKSAPARPRTNYQLAVDTWPVIWIQDFKCSRSGSGLRSMNLFLAYCTVRLFGQQIRADLVVGIMENSGELN